MPAVIARLSLSLLAIAACTGDIGGGGGGASATAPDAATSSRGAESLVRGAQWVAAKVPYCQAPNHQHDGDTSCATTCDRPDNPDWDAYRSDCSGFVSWAWELPAPGRTTKGFAPFDTTMTHAIDAADLAPGDAVNNNDHVMLFEAWTVPGSEAKFMEETGCSSQTPYAVETTASVTLSGETLTVQYHGTYTAIRYDAAP